jgi:UDP-N-acetyl-2-amino-2-deoxyglucuronate dehydrogenase
MNSCHYVDMVRHLAGVEVSGVSALAATVDGEMEVEDSISVALRYRNGAIGSIVASSAVRGTMSNEVQLWGRDGHIVVEPRGRFYSLRHVGAGRTSRWQHFDGLPAINSRMAYVSRLASAIDRGEEPDVSAQDGLVVQALIESAYRSAEEGRLIDPGALVRVSRASDVPTREANGRPGTVVKAGV